MLAQRGQLACSKTAKRDYCFYEIANIINLAGTFNSNHRTKRHKIKKSTTS